MAGLKFEASATTDSFRIALDDKGITLPVCLHEEDIGVIVDANGVDVATVDVNGERPDEEVMATARLLVLAINTCGGFQAEIA